MTPISISVPSSIYLCRPALCRRQPPDLSSLSPLFIYTWIISAASFDASRTSSDKGCLAMFDFHGQDSRKKSDGFHDLSTEHSFSPSKYSTVMSSTNPSNYDVKFNRASRFLGYFSNWWIIPNLKICVTRTINYLLLFLQKIYF